MTLLSISIITLIFYIIIFIIIYKLLKSILKTILSLLLLTFLISGVFIFLVYNDYKDIQENLPNSKNLIIFSNNDEVLGVVLINSIENKNYTLLKDNELSDLLNKDYKIILKERNLFKIITIDIKFIKESNLESLTLGGLLLNKNQIITILESKNTFEELKTQLNLPIDIRQMPENEELPKDQYQLKAALFIASVQDIIDKEGIGFVIEQDKKGNLQIYKETILFKIIKLLPTDTIKKIGTRNIYK